MSILPGDDLWPRGWFGRWLDRIIDDFIIRIRDSKRVPLLIGPPTDPTYHRWFVWPRNRFLNCYLHHFHHDDEEHLHTHRMLNISWLLQNEYFEERFVCKPKQGWPLPETDKFLVRQHSFLMRLPSTPHRVVLKRDEDGRPVPVWSLFIGFPQIFEWGFWCPGRGYAYWKHWSRYAATNNPNDPRYGEPGEGCGE